MANLAYRKFIFILHLFFFTSYSWCFVIIRNNLSWVGKKNFIRGYIKKTLKLQEVKWTYNVVKTTTENDEWLSKYFFYEKKFFLNSDKWCYHQYLHQSLGHSVHIRKHSYNFIFPFFFFFFLPCFAATWNSVLKNNHISGFKHFEVIMERT